MYYLLVTKIIMIRQFHPSQIVKHFVPKEEPLASFEAASSSTSKKVAGQLEETI